MIYTKMTVKAMNIAYCAHEGQMDQNGVPYIFHPIHLAEQMEDEITCTVALLHDVVEDTDVSLDDLMAEFPAEVTDAVACLTHASGVNYFDYVRKIKENPIAKKVKLADLAHNSDPDRASAGKPIDEKKIKMWHDKYAKAKEILESED